MICSPLAQWPGVWLPRTGEIIDECRGLPVAERNERVSLEHEGERCRLGLFHADADHRRKRHELRAVLLIEAGGDFELPHLLARWQRNAEQLFDLGILRGRWRQDVDPHDTARTVRGRARSSTGLLKPGSLVSVVCDHASLSGAKASIA